MCERGKQPSAIICILKNENLEVERIVDFSGETEKNIRLLTFRKMRRRHF